jgi:hypothetical protein
LKYNSTIRRPPGIEEIIFTRGDEPFPVMSELERQDARLMEMQLILLRRTTDMEDFNTTAFHTNC